ncbi:hypothetical protein [Halodesulfovibrio spirochaetisodalis]|uniref:Uncharacterized protein n=1 Tax=Halodesulfovibrio spirochaetisodalis TaxID=1560234 RepID=A0A1B7XEW5_9BACT|nr:hypothetical protein [Halodesulfovibrio spirochaetisodalis]OBQ52736.1 hypothetical protein SP90_07215 [Halodesulfovibrio spirochaetisodalis]
MSSVTVTQNNFNGGELSPLMGARTDQTRYGNGCKKLHNMLVLPHGPATRRPGFQYLGECYYKDRYVRLIPFTFNADQTYILEFGHKYMRIWKDGGLVINKTGRPVEVHTPWTSELVPALSVCQSADVMFVACSAYEPCRILRKAHDVWHIESVRLGSRMKVPFLLDAKVKEKGTRDYSYIVTAIDPFTREESGPSESFTVKGPETISVDDPVTLTWESENKDAVYAVYKCWNESGKYGFVGQAKKRRWIDRGATPDFKEGFPIYRTMFQRADAYPSVVQFYQQRLCFAATNSQPQTVWMSRSGSYNNFNISDPLRDDDSIAATIAAERVNKIEWMLPGRRLIVGTAGSEWSLGGAENKAITPSSIKFERQSVIGAAPLAPLLVGENILFVQHGGKVIRELQYSLQRDGYMGTELSILSEHLFRDNPVVSWAYQQEPYSIIWCVLQDGSLVGATYERGHDVIGWHKHSSQGKFESVCCIQGKDGDELWCVVRREINGEERRYIERLVSYGAQDVTEQIFMDSAMSYRGEKTEVCSGLEHLEGKTVQILADGYVCPPQVVRNGRIQLPTPASVVHAGLQYTSELIPVEPEIVLTSGSSSGKARRVGRVCAKFHESAGVQIGAGASAPRDVAMRDEPGLDLPPALFSGEKVVDVSGGYAMQSDVVFRMEEPLPATLLSYTMQVEIGER